MLRLRENHKHGEIINDPLKIGMKCVTRKGIAPRDTFDTNFLDYTLLPKREFFPKNINAACGELIGLQKKKHFLEQFTVKQL